MTKTALWLAILFVSSACGSEPDSGNPDSGNPDSGNPDSGNPDSGNPDSGDPDGDDSRSGEPGAAADAGQATVDAQVPTRAFYLGFTPWPYDATSEALSWTYDTINAQGDVISHHMEEGVPWPEAYADAPFPAAYANEIQDRLDDTQPGKHIFLSINAINVGRDGLAPYRGANANEVLPPPWDSYALDSPEVEQAYSSYAKRMIALFNPDYVAIGVEVNLLVRNAPSLWPAYLELHKYVYQDIKLEFPNLPVLASFDVTAILEGYNLEDDHAAQMQALQDILPYVDALGISLHPFLSVYLADTVPESLFDDVFALTSKPIAITESSYPAQVWSIDVGGTTVTFSGSQAKQEDFVGRLLGAAQAHEAPFVIWFTARDYDALWKALGESDAALPWRDTGLYDEQGSPRPGLAVWQRALAEPHF